MVPCFVVPTGIPLFYLALLVVAPLATNGSEEEPSIAGTCLTRGHWEEGDARRPPPYVARVTSDGKDVDARTRRARSRFWRQTACSNATVSAPWRHYEWRPDDRSATCAALVAEVDRMAEPSIGGTSVCEALGHRNILFVGDSISLQMYEVTIDGV